MTVLPLLPNMWATNVTLFCFGTFSVVIDIFLDYRSCEQKEEFLRSHVKPVFPPPRDGREARDSREIEGRDKGREGARDVGRDAEVIAREFYARPQRMAQPTWPPEERGRATVRPLARIHEGTPADTSPRSGFGANSFDSDPGRSILGSMNKKLLQIELPHLY